MRPDTVSEGDIRRKSVVKTVRIAAARPLNFGKTLSLR